MKYIALYLQIVCAFMLYGCSIESNEQIIETYDNGCVLHTVPMTFYGHIDNFGGSTRAATSDWDDGAKLYIQYQTVSGRVDGTATYNRESGLWSVQYYGSITRDQITRCEVYFFDNPESFTQNVVKLSANSAVFADNEASYIFKDGQIKLTAHLKSITGRIRFNGIEGQKINVSYMKYYSNYDLAKNELFSQEATISLNVNSDGYTPYVYIFFSDTLNRKMVIDSGDETYVFCKNFDYKILEKGSSGYIDVPTLTSRNGWRVIEHDSYGYCPDIDHPHAIDMGNGVYWSCCNVGASSPKEHGNYYAWGEVTTKTTFTWNTYTLCNGSKKTMKKYCNSSSYGTVDNKFTLELSDDVANKSLGGEWHIPTKDDFRELIKNCSWTWQYSGGYKVRSSNGNVIFFPKSGCYNEDGYEGGYDVDNMNYWTSSLDATSPNCAIPVHSHDNTVYVDSVYTIYRYVGMTIRPIR